jgi:type VI secretion system FHA domain protein
MLLALSIISAQGASLGPTAYKVFDERGGSIGRLESNDWILPDPERFVSSRHARVRCTSGAFYLEDTSTNGTFLNAHNRPVSKAEPAKLSDGDRIFIGEYEILAQLIEDAAPALSAASPVIAPAVPADVDPLALLGGAAPATPPHFMSAPSAAMRSHEPGAIPDDWQLTGLRGSAQAAIPPPPVPAVTAFAAPAVSVAVQPTGAAPPALPVTGGPADLLLSLGIDPARVEPAVYQQLGSIIRIVVQGLIDVLQSRAEVKNNFRMPMTSIRPVENNPLKFSMNAEDALHNLFVKRNPGYLPAVEAFQEGFRDVAYHQMAMLAGIRTAFNSMLAKFDPEHLEEVYERKLKRTALIAMGNRLKYWELYRTQFEEIEKDRETHFQLLFGEEFAKAYSEQLQKLAAASRHGSR